jgi:hypothetical protein
LDALKHKLESLNKPSHARLNQAIANVESAMRLIQSEMNEERGPDHSS